MPALPWRTISSPECTISWISAGARTGDLTFSLFFLSLFLLLFNSSLCSLSPYPHYPNPVPCAYTNSHAKSHLLIKLRKLLWTLWLVISFNHEHLQFLGTPLPLNNNFWACFELDDPVITIMGAEYWKSAMKTEFSSTTKLFQNHFQPRYRDFSYSIAENFLSHTYCISCTVGSVQCILDMLTHQRLQVSQYKYIQETKQETA